MKTLFTIHINMKTFIEHLSEDEKNQKKSENKAQLYKLYKQGMSVPSGSPKHNEIKDRVRELRKKLGM